MRKTFVIMFLMVMFASPLMASPTVYLTGQSGYHSGVGGEFTATLSGWSWDPLVCYSDSTKNIGNYDPSFQTFCIEYNEHFNPGTTYDVTFGDKAINGGVGPSGDPISIGTAWLYHEFQNGTLAGYHYTTGARSNDAGALQNAIWYLEQESNGSLTTAYSTLLSNKFGSVANAMVDNAGTYSVMVMNMWTAGHAGDLNYRAQDQLVCIPVVPPPPAVPAPGAVLLGGIGIGLVGWLKRRQIF